MAVRREENALSRVARDPVSRRRFIALGGGSAAAAAFLAACGSSGGSATGAGDPAGGDAVVEERFGKGDAGILNYALTLENVVTAFYYEVTHSDLFHGSELALIEKVLEEETQHIEALVYAVNEAGAKPAPEPKTKFPLKNPRSVLELASRLEDLGAAAYLGQMLNLKSEEQLSEFFAIQSVEGRHAAAISTLLGRSITAEGAFAKPADAKTVFRSIEPFIVG
jgi:Ferritin-like domain